MAVNIEALVQHLMEDPDLIPPDGQSKEDVARAMATQRAKQSSNNEKALNMVKAENKVNQLLSFLKAEGDNEELNNMKDEMFSALDNVASGEIDPREFSKHQRNFEKHSKVLEAGKDFPNTTAGRRAKKEFADAKAYLDKPGVLPQSVRLHEAEMEKLTPTEDPDEGGDSDEDQVSSADLDAEGREEQAAVSELEEDAPDPEAEARSAARQERDDEFFNLNQRARRAGYDLKNEDNPLNDEEIAALQAHEDGEDLDQSYKVHVASARRKLTSESMNEIKERRERAIARPAKLDAQHSFEREKQQKAQAQADAEQAEAADKEENFWHPSNFTSADAHEKVMGLFGGDEDIANQFIEAYEKGGGSKGDFLNSRGKVNKGALEKIGKVEDFVKNLPASTPEQAERDKETSEEQGVEEGSPLMEARREQQSIPDADLEDDYADALVDQLDKLGSEDQQDWEDVASDLDDTDIDGYNEALVDFLNNKMDAHNAAPGRDNKDKIVLPQKFDPTPAPVPEADREAIASSTTEEEAEAAVQTAEHRITSSNNPVAEKVSDVENLASFVRETGKDKPVVGKVTSAHTPESVVVGEVLDNPESTEAEKVDALQEIPGEAEQRATLEAHDHTPSAVERLTERVRAPKPRQPYAGTGEPTTYGDENRDLDAPQDQESLSALDAYNQRQRAAAETPDEEDNVFADSESDAEEDDENLPEDTFEATPLEAADRDHSFATDQGWGGNDVEENHFDEESGELTGSQGYPHDVKAYAEANHTDEVPLIGANGEPHDDIYDRHGLGDEDSVTIEHVQDHIKESTGKDAPKADWQGGTTTEQETKEPESEDTDAEQGTTETDEPETTDQESTDESGGTGEGEPEPVVQRPARQGQQRLGDAPGGEDFRRRKDGDVAQPVRQGRAGEGEQPEPDTATPEGQRSFDEGTQMGLPGMPRAERATPTETTEETEPQPEGVPEGQQSFEEYRQSGRPVEARRIVSPPSRAERDETQRAENLDRKRQDLVSNFKQDQDYVDSLSDEKLESLHSKHTDKKQELNANQEIQSSAARAKRTEILQAMARSEGKEGDEAHLKELEEKHQFDDPKDLTKLHREQQARRADNAHKMKAEEINAKIASMSDLPEGADKHEVSHRMRELMAMGADHRRTGEQEGKSLLDANSQKRLSELGEQVGNTGKMTDEEMGNIKQEVDDMGSDFMDSDHQAELQSKYDKDRAHHKEAIDHISSEEGHEDRVHAFDHSKAHELHHVDEEGNTTAVSHSKMGEDGKAVHTDEGTQEDAHGGRTASKPPKLLGLDKDAQADQAEHFELAKKYHDPKYVGTPESGSAKAGMDRMKELEEKNPQLADPKYKGQLMGGQGSHLNSELGGQQMSGMGMSENEQEEARLEAGKPPGPPPKPGLVWAPGSKHWVLPETLREMQGGLSAGGGSYLPQGIPGFKEDGTEGNSGPAMVSASGLHPVNIPGNDFQTDSMGGHGDMAGHILGQALGDHHTKWDEGGQKGNSIKVDSKVLDSTGINHSEIHGGGGGEGSGPTPGPQPTARQQAQDSSNQGNPSETGVQRQANRRGDPKASPLAEALMRARGHTSDEAKGRTLGQEAARGARDVAGSLPVVGSLFRGDKWTQDRIQDKIGQDNKASRAVSQLQAHVTEARKGLNYEE